MSEDYMTPEFQKKLADLSRYWAKYFDQLSKWVEEDRVAPLEPLDPNLTPQEQWRVVGARENLEKNKAIKKHISSTHTWIPGKMHWSKKTNNGYQSPLECKTCGMGASGYDELGWVGEEIHKVDLEAGDVPSRDMHGGYIHRTCQEVVAARAEARKKHKGGKCGQCRTYGCIHKDT